MNTINETLRNWVGKIVVISFVFDEKDKPGLYILKDINEKFILVENARRVEALINLGAMEFISLGGEENMVKFFDYRAKFDKDPSYKGESFSPFSVKKRGIRNEP